MLVISNSESDLDLLRSELKDRTSELEQQLMALEQARGEGKANIEALHLILRKRIRSRAPCPWPIGPKLRMRFMPWRLPSSPFARDG